MVCKDWAAASAMPSELWRQASGLDSLCGSYIAHEVYMADNLSFAIPRLPTKSVVPSQIPHNRSDMHSLERSRPFHVGTVTPCACTIPTCKVKRLAVVARH